MTPAVPKAALMSALLLSSVSRIFFLYLLFAEAEIRPESFRWIIDIDNDCDSERLWFSEMRESSRKLRYES